MGKPNAAGKAGAILNILAGIVVVLIGFILLSFTSTTTEWLGETTSFSIIKLIWLLYILFGLIMIVISIIFMISSKFKLLLGLVSILTGLGLISGILILISQPEE